MQYKVNILIVGKEVEFQSALKDISNISTIFVNEGGWEKTAASTLIDLIFFNCRWKTRYTKTLEKLIPSTALWLERQGQSKEDLNHFEDFCEKSKVEYATVQLGTNTSWAPFFFLNHNAQTRSTFLGCLRGHPTAYSSRISNLYEIGVRIDYLVQKDPSPAPSLLWYSVLPELARLAFQISSQNSSQGSVTSILPMYAAPLSNDLWFIFFQIFSPQKNIQLMKQFAQEILNNSTNHLIQTSNTTFAKFTPNCAELGILFSPNATKADNGNIIIHSVPEPAKISADMTAKKIVTFPDIRPTKQEIKS